MREAVIVSGARTAIGKAPRGVMAPDPTLIERAPAHYMGMGHTGEEVARRFGISREDQDAFGLESHRRAASAIREGRFRDETVPVTFQRRRLENGKVVGEEVTFD